LPIADLNLASKALSVKCALRSLLRSPNLTAVTIGSVALALALAVSFNILASSVKGTMTHFYDDDLWNVVVDFRVPVHDDQIRDFVAQGIIERYEGYLKGMSSLAVCGEKTFGQIIGLQAPSSMRVLRILSGRAFTDNNAHEVILNRNLWKEKRLEIGQDILVETVTGERKMKLVGIVDEVNIAIEYAYVPIGTAQELLGKDGCFSGIWAISKSTAEQAKAVLYRNELVSRVTHKKDLAKIIDQYIIGLKAGLRSMMTMVMLLAPIFLFTSMGLSMLEKEKDYIILRSMGAKKTEIVKTLMTEALVMGSLGTLLSVPLAVVMGTCMNKVESSLSYTLTTYVYFTDYIYLLLCLPLFPFVAWIFSRRICRLNIVQKLMERIG
jgi:ABC-type lipoprotein release transport system permease subunit